jgi:hypothetical protein
MGWREIVNAGGWKTRVWWDLALVSLSPFPPVHKLITSVRQCIAALENGAESTLGVDLPGKLGPVKELVRVRLEALVGRKGVVEDVLREMRG